ncbi:hypothetical protein VHEMI09263 [[Torrubiella] hemipterigena]|uniref:Zn(2)-C6 fungal-type domain-containing protein n=1 Tax=[Torrubiella] hemipterigena TaxID=1531966 RepID=A0A0A1TPS5_9HYPO|nr:hypothetical protein VHEMI09263 [[Torrubiella] hemipterigena]
MMTPADEDVQPHRSDDGTKIWNCVACRRRKLKCDRQEPCSGCTKNGLECHYPVTGRIPRRSRAPPSWDSPHQRQSELLHKLTRLESIVTELSGQVEDGKLTTFSSDVTPESGADVVEDFGNLIVRKDGKLKIERKFWSIFCTEVDSIFQALHESASSDGDPSTNSANSLDISLKHQYLHTSPIDHEYIEMLNSRRVELWDIFVSNVDPFVKVLSLVDTAAAIHTGDMLLTTEGRLLFLAISFGAMTSMTPQQLNTIFPTKTDEILSQVAGELDAHLTALPVLTATNVTILQATTIYIATLPNGSCSDKGPPLSAILLQQVMAFEGASSEKEQELVCRLKWQSRFLATAYLPTAYRSICSLNSHITPKAHGMDFGGTATSVLDLLQTRCEIWRLATQVSHCPKDLRGNLNFIKKTKWTIEVSASHRTKEDFDSFLTALSQFSLAKVEQAVYLSFLAQSKASMDDDAIEDANFNCFASSLAVLDSGLRLINNPDWSSWRWQMHGSYPWSSIGTISNYLTGNPWSPMSEWAWVLMQSLVTTLPSQLKVSKALWDPVEQMINSSRGARDRAMENTMATSIATGDILRMVEDGSRIFYSEAIGRSYPNEFHIV